MGNQYSREKVEPIASELYTLYSNPTPYEVYPDAAEFLSKTAPHDRRPFALGVITNFDRRIHKVVDQLGLEFDFLVCSEDAGASKPEGAIFARALEASGVPGISAGEAAHVGDDEGKDIVGARAAGWTSVLLDREGEKGEGSVADHVCPTFREVYQVLKLEERLKDKS